VEQEKPGRKGMLCNKWKTLLHQPQHFQVTGGLFHGIISFSEPLLRVIGLLRREKVSNQMELDYE